MSSWLNGWSSEWGEPWLMDEVDLAARVSTKDNKRAHKTTNTHMELMSLPEDLLAGVTMMILLIDTKGSRWARTCKACNELFKGARLELFIDGIAWWTGSKEPSTPPPIMEPPSDLLPKAREASFNNIKKASLATLVCSISILRNNKEIRRNNHDSL